MSIELAEPDLVVDGTDVVGPDAKSTALAPFNPLRAGLAALRQKYSAYKPDLSTKEGEAIARANRRELVTLRTSTDKAYDAVNGPLLAIQRDARALKKSLHDEIEKYEAPIDDAIKAVEAERAAEKARKEEEERQRLASIRHRMAAIAAIPVGHVRSTLAQLQDAIVQLGTLQVTEIEFGEFVEDAEGVKANALAELDNLMVAAMERELAEQRLAEERATAERLRQQEQARLDAERAELDRQRQELAAAAERERLAAIERDRLAIIARQAEADAAAKRNAEAQARADEQAALLKKQTDAFEVERLAANRAIEEERQAIARERAELAAASAPAEPPSDLAMASVCDALPSRQDAVSIGDPAVDLDRVATVAPMVDALQHFADKVPPARPSDEDIINLIAETYDVTIEVAVDYLESIDLFAARERLGEEA